MDIDRIFMKQFNCQMNFITPTLVRYGEINNRLVYEISSGAGILDESRIFGVTILEINEDGSSKTTNLDYLADSLDDAEKYIESIRQGENNER